LSSLVQPPEEGSHPLQNTELLDIEASIQSLVRRAYDLGRNDALKKVVDVLNGDRPFAEQLALMGPKGGTREHEHENMSEPEPTTAGAPWWAWPVR
jgi:hypothetical protein